MIVIGHELVKVDKGVYSKQKRELSVETWGPPQFVEEVTMVIEKDWQGSWCPETPGKR